MKKLTAILLAVLLLFTLGGCETQAERELRQAQETADQLEEQYRQAQQEYNNLLEDIAAYEAAVDRLP